MEKYKKSIDKELDKLCKHYKLENNFTVEVSETSSSVRIAVLYNEKSCRI